MKRAKKAARPPGALAKALAKALAIVLFAALAAVGTVLVIVYAHGGGTYPLVLGVLSWVTALISTYIFAGSRPDG